MNVAVTSEHRYDRTPDGAVWTQTAHAYGFWTRYLITFDHVKVVARVRDVPQVEPGAKRADGPGVSVFPVPYYVGPVQYLKLRSAVIQKVRQSVAADEAVMMRVPSQIADCLAPALRRVGRPYGVEVITDPWDAFSPQANPHPLRPFFRRWGSHQLRRHCSSAAGAAYVTAAALQRRYPCPRHMAAMSDVELNACPILPAARCFADMPDAARRKTVITVGSLDHLYKSPDVLIKAIAACVAKGFNIQLRIVGDGRNRQFLEDLAASLKLGDRVVFLGSLPSVVEQLDEADLFALPSRQEGLPRALVEAMARGLPCIGSEVGGIPELLAPEDIVPRNDVEALAKKIQEVLSDSGRAQRMAARNLEKAKEYDEAKLRELRGAFFSYLQDATEHWFRERRQR